jgi:hypothetical protein
VEDDNSIPEAVGARLPLRVKIAEWWTEATGPVTQSPHLSMTRAFMARVFMWIPVLVVAALLAGIVGGFVFIRWRAADLAGKSVALAREGNLRMATLLAASAERLHSGDPRVLHARALVETLRDNPQSPALWEAMPREFPLTPEDLLLKARAMTRFGSDAQHRVAIELLEGSGLSTEAEARNAERRLARRDYDEALRHARGAAASGDPQHRLALAQLLATRHGPLLADPRRATAIDFAAAEEITLLVDSLADTSLRDEAVAFGLGVPQIETDARLRWALMVMKEPSPHNPALLAAADVLIGSGAQNIRDVSNLLTPLFRDAPLDRRSAFAAFLAWQGLPGEALSFVDADEAARDPAAFRARSAALAATGQWEEALALTNLTGTLPEDLRLLARAHAARQLGRDGLCRMSVSAAVTHGLRAGNLAGVLRSADAAGERTLADEFLLAACADPGQAGAAFRAARDRFGRRGQFASLADARGRATAAAPRAPSLEDDRRRLDLLAGRPVDPSLTAATLAEDPFDTDYRVTHALALMRDGRPQEAWEVFEDVTLFFHSLAPGQQAVIAALADAKGEARLAAELAGAIDLSLLPDAELVLLAPLRQ